jgi:hypothetical protein
MMIIEIILLYAVTIVSLIVIILLIMFKKEEYNPEKVNASDRKAADKQFPKEEGPGGFNDANLTAAKRPETNPFYTQVTPKPQRKILLYGQDKSRHLFPLVRDRDIGIQGTYQNVVIESVKMPI